MFGLGIVLTDSFPDLDGPVELLVRSSPTPLRASPGFAPEFPAP
jgi:hypothetical protein